ncbi:leucine-rich repeat protein 1-like [Patiria miniata]|uniref:PIF1/LRR1 pleckstrin homology domain-containing protein n=1 Tax=Patiria miniata TaxID=46514 RepID=A0A914BIL5_PATMI|nr:leucine-rich repeat protein 1-like [Patiria miniata]XP_038075686.1 leucine-rich repeat protein 1-like [Patiria miniata]XP_038075687.1 leucine-rich repeat protein 1-like [Patiria miniata]
MRLSCDVDLKNRLLPSHGMAGKSRPMRCSLAIGRRGSSDSNPEGAVFLMVCSAKNKTGTKYKLKENMEQVFARFIEEGKATLRLKEPAQDICISKADPLQLKNFLSVLKLGYKGQSSDLSKVHLSTLTPATTAQVERPKTKLVILRRSDYPVLERFPKGLESLRVNGCGLSRVDPRILELKSLRALDLSGNRIRALPNDPGQLSALAELKVANNLLERLPPSLCLSSLRTSLQFLDLAGNSLKFFPPQICDLASLLRLNVANNQLTSLPEHFGQLSRLRFFSAAENQIEVLPFSFMDLAMEEVDFSGNCFKCEMAEGSAAGLQRTQDGFPSLLEVAARAIKKQRVSYTEEDLPRHLYHHLSQVKWCVCSGPCFQPYAKHRVPFNLHRVAHTLVGPTAAPIQGFICSAFCLSNLQANPNAPWKCRRK